MVRRLVKGSLTVVLAHRDLGMWSFHTVIISLPTVLQHSLISGTWTMSERYEATQYIPLTVETLPLDLLHDAFRRRARFTRLRIWLGL